jgi:ankyrin repeat protein
MSNNGQEVTALSVAVQHLNVQAVKALLKAGAVPHACNSRGRNVLMVAVGERGERGGRAAG